MKNRVQLIAYANRLGGTFAGLRELLAGPLAGAGISIFNISTHDTDYVLVKSADLARAVSALEGAGHRVQGFDPGE